MREPHSSTLTNIFRHPASCLGVEMAVSLFLDKGICLDRRGPDQVRSTCVALAQFQTDYQIKVVLFAERGK